MKRILASLILASLVMTTLPLNATAAETDDIPTNAAATGVHDSLVAALAHADLVTTLEGTGPFTVFAPTDDAFAAAGINLADFDTAEENATLSDILLYHVYSGAVASSDVTDGLTVSMVNGDDATFTVATDGTVMIGEATVTTADVQASNGVIHVIDKVLMPPADLVDIPTVATSTGVHTALVAALAQASLVETLQGVGPFTVFAPTDAAFTAAGIDLSELTTEAGLATLTDILLYHVYSGAVASSDVTDGLTVSMANGDDATFTVATDGTVMIGDATVTTADVQASNGVIHVIDKVLMPPVDLVDIPTVAASTGVHTALVAALAQAGLVETLQGAGPFTVFAPTDAAFTAAGIDLSELTTEAGLATLTDILLYHVVAGQVNAADVTDGLVAAAVNGDNLTFAVSNGTVTVNGATVTTADVATSNGVIHVIDAVLMPPADPVGPAGEICYNLNTHMIVAGADEATCGAFMYLENYTMNGQEITGCYNSITHAVSNVSQAVCESYMWTPSVDIAMTAGATGIHTSLVAALAKANLVATLQGDGPFTVFAPSDAAFTAAGINLDDFTTDAQIAALADILLFHVVSGQVNAADVTDGLVAAAVNGDNLTFVVANGTVTVNGATVTLADVPASNGVIHVIDAVLMPPTDVVEPVLPDCDITVTIAPSGLKFSPSEITVAVGETVCWQWTDESMAHNVREVDGDKSTTYAVDGVTSGASSTTVDFRHTFDVDSTTFYYACEPHLASGMFGKVVVGDGGAVVVPTPVDDSDMDSDEESVPGFLGVMATVALAGAALVSSRRDE